jgi:hypothetical protein
MDGRVRLSSPDAWSLLVFRLVSWLSRFTCGCIRVAADAGYSFVVVRCSRLLEIYLVFSPDRRLPMFYSRYTVSLPSSPTLGATSLLPSVPNFRSSTRLSLVGLHVIYLGMFRVGIIRTRLWSHCIRFWPISYTGVHGELSADHALPTVWSHCTRPVYRYDASF